jgi:predicted TIM-barrel fold metal-dependent hydrolase
MMWSNDYPHITSDWPHSWKTINAAFANVPTAERRAILAGNAQRVFGFGMQAGAASATARDQQRIPAGTAH